MRPFIVCTDMISGASRYFKSSFRYCKVLSSTLLKQQHQVIKFNPVRMSSSKAQFVFPDDQPIVKLDASNAWNALTKDEQLYSHYLSKASWWGGLVVLLQTSPESPDIFR